MLEGHSFGGPSKEEGSVYPPRFDYLAPASVEEVIEALGERGGDAKVMAGGQSLIPVLKLRIASVGTIVDLNRVEGLDEIGEEDGRLRIGALVRHVQADRSPPPSPSASITSSTDAGAR